MKLVIAEKPSVGAALAKALGAREKKKGYIEGDDLIVSWCVGHLVELADADVYDEKYRKWNMLIMMQKPEATLVKGFQAWRKDFERNVNKGEKGIQILAPSFFKKETEQQKHDPITDLVRLINSSRLAAEICRQFFYYQRLFYQCDYN